MLSVVFSVVFSGLDNLPRCFRTPWSGKFNTTSEGRVIAVTTRFLGDDDAHLLVDHCLSKLGMVNNCLDIIGYTIGVLHVFLYSDIVF